MCKSPQHERPSQKLCIILVIVAAHQIQDGAIYKNKKGYPLAKRDKQKSFEKNCIVYAIKFELYRAQKN